VPENSKHELPARYAPLVKYVATKFPEQTSAFESAFKRIESRRLLEAQKLRKTLQSYWFAPDEQLKSLSPLDLVHYFEAHAEAIFRAAGEICLGQFHDSQSYSAFLQAVEDWILDAMLPDRKTFEESQDDLIGLAEDMLKRAESKGLDHLLVRDLAASVVNLKLDIQTPMMSKLLKRAIDQARIIDLRESFSAFEARHFWNNQASPSGDWGVLLNDSRYDALFTEGLSAVGDSAAFETIVALSDATNRESARCIWMIALKQLKDTLLAAWWNTAADAHARANADPADIEPKIRRLESDGVPTGRLQGASRRSPRYERIDEALREIAASRPKSHAQVFQSLHDRNVPYCARQPFKSAGGWLKGFRRDQHKASAWLSHVWGRLNLTPFPRGPKK